MIEWVDIQYKKTLESTMVSLKEHLTGAGMDVRLAKTQEKIDEVLSSVLNSLKELK